MSEKEEELQLSGTTAELEPPSRSAISEPGFDPEVALEHEFMRTCLGSCGRDFPLSAEEERRREAAFGRKKEPPFGIPVRATHKHCVLTRERRLANEWKKGSQLRSAYHVAHGSTPSSEVYHIDDVSTEGELAESLKVLGDRWVAVSADIKVLEDGTRLCRAWPASVKFFGYDD
jgi:hypothetical protein